MSVKTCIEEKSHFVNLKFFINVNQGCVMTFWVYFSLSLAHCETWSQQLNLKDHQVLHPENKGLTGARGL